MRNRFLKRSLIRKRLRRTTAVCLALLLLLTQLVVVAAATEKKIIGISAVAQNVLIEDYDGSLIPWWDEEANEKEYFNYYVSNSNPLFTVTYADGSVTTSEGAVINEEMGLYSYPSYQDDQTYDNQWGVGKHMVTATFNIDTQSFTCNFEVEVVAMPVESVTATVERALIENYDGGYSNGPSGGYFDYWVSNCNPTYTVIYKDGTVYSGSEYEIWSQTGYYPSINLEQSAENPLSVGVHEATVSFLGASSTIYVEIVENPVESITATAGKSLIENYDGGYLYGPSGGYSYYWVSQCNPTYTITYKDGTVYTGSEREIWQQTGYYPSDRLEQSEENPLGVGTYDVPISFLGVYGTLQMEIVETPVESITATAGKSLIENYDGGYLNGPSGGYFNYWVSNCNPTYTITYKDGTVYTGSEYEIWQQTGFYPSDQLEQSEENPLRAGIYDVPISFLGVTGTLKMEIAETPVASITVQSEPLVFGIEYADDDAILTVTYKDGTVYKGEPDEIGWATGYSSPKLNWNEENQVLGTNTGEVTFLGKTYPFTYQVVENPYTALEILSVEPIDEELNGNYEWVSLDFSYRLTKVDGTQEVGYTHGYGYVDLGFRATVEKLGEWGVGKANKFIATVAGVSAEGSVEIIPKNKDFTYIVFDENIIITGNRTCPENLVIPEEIDGYPVVGISHLSDGGTIKTVTVPDSVRLLSNEWCSDLSVLETITLGKSVGTIACDMFRENEALENIFVSEEHAEYTSKDGIVYSKDMSTLVAYPLGKTGVYTVPAEVSDIEVLNARMYDRLRFTVSSESQSYVTVDGVTYTADMKKVMFCDPQKAGDYVMPDSVEQINDRAFADCEKLESVHVSDKVTDIVYGAFADCKSLKSVELPETIQSIGKQAFGNCESLTAFNTPLAVSQIGARAFAGSTALASVSLNAGLQYIGESAFAQCEQLQSITLPNSITEIQPYTFSKCFSLSAVTIPDRVTDIGGNAFEYCNSLTSIVIPDSVKTLGYHVFYSCENLQSATVGSGVTDLNFAFDDCFALKTIELPDTLTTLSTYEFRNTAYYAEESNWENGVLYLDGYLIGANSHVSGAYTVIPGTRYIADGAFSNCNALTDIIIPSSITSIGDSTFSGCDSLINVTIPDSVTSIEQYAFSDCDSLTNVTIPNSVTSIGEYAFSGTSITALNLPNGLQTIENQAFAYTPIESIRIPDSVTDMVYGFYGSNIREIEMPDTLVSLDHDFHNTPWYEAQPEGPVYLGRMLYFYKGEMRNYTNVVVKEGTLGISDYAFAEQTNLTGISLPEGLLDIGTGTFAECRNLTGITLPSTLQTIQTEAFRNCALETIDIPASVTEIGYNAFAGCTKLKEIRVAADNPNYSSIDGVLYNKDGTELICCPEGKTGTLVLPVQIEKIPMYAFSNTALTGIVVYNDNLEFGYWAFNSWAVDVPNPDIEQKPIYLYANRGSTTEAYAKSSEQIFVELRSQTDAATDVTVAEGAPDSLPKDTILQATQVSTSANQVTYNITLTQNGAAVQPTGEVTVKIPVPDTLDGEQCAVYREEADGTQVILNAVYRDGYMVFTTDVFGSFTLAKIIPPVTLGDVNGDGTIDAADAVMIQRYDSGLTTLTDEQLAAADVNADGLVDAADAVKIQRYDAGLIASL